MAQQRSTTARINAIRGRVDASRSQVARMLGKSIATVRRMEGTELNPTQDERGVWHFNAEEVERVARGERSGAPRAPRPHRTADLEALRAELEGLRATRETDVLDAEHEHQVLRLQLLREAEARR